MKDVKHRRCFCVVVLGACTAVFCCLRAQQTTTAITGFWPLYDVARSLQAQYGKPVTFEAPRLVWREHMQKTSVLPNGTEMLTSKRHAMLLPATGVFDATTLTRSVVETAVSAYHDSAIGYPRYRVLESSLGFHIVPTDARDETGTLRPTNSVLDANVVVLPERRTAFEHLTALLQAVTSSSGTVTRTSTVEVGFNREFAANGYLVTGVAKDTERPYELFEWGASEINGRNALIDLLGRSSTTMSWFLLCRPDYNTGNAQQICYLSVDALWVGPKRTLVTFDRCTSCRPVPPATNK
jgi:hypothetical protein